MKVMIPAIAALLCTTLCYSQTNVKTRYNTSNVKLLYPALVKHVTKENNYLPVFPEKLVHYPSHRHMQADGITFPYSDMSFKAKIKREDPEMYMVVEAPGISDLQAKGIRRSANGFVVDYTYLFPCTLIIQDHAKKTVYTITIVPEGTPQSVAYNKGLGNYNTMTYAPAYFATEKEAQDYLQTNKDISRQIERYAMLTAYKEIASVMTALYNDYTERHQLQWAEITNAGGTALYTELNTAASQLKQAYDLLGDAKNTEATPLLQQAKQVFEKYRNSSDPAISAPVKDMILYNLAWASLLTGDTKTALELYAEGKPAAGWQTAYTWDELKTMAEFEQSRNRIRQAIGK